MKPMLATAGDIPLRADWAYEVKWDGMRLLCHLAGGRVRLSSRAGNDVTVSFPEVVAAAAELAELNSSSGFLLDGEIVVMDPEGLPSFPALGPRMHVQSASRAVELAEAQPVQYLAFDLLELDGSAMSDHPYDRRRDALESLGLPRSVLSVPERFDDGEQLLAATASRGLEGVVAKRRASPYRPGVRSPDWVKRAHRATTEVVIAGWRKGEGKAAGRVGSLVTATIAPDGSLIYAGTAGSGINDSEGRILGQVLSSIECAAPELAIPADDLKALAREGFRWCEPLLVAEILHLGASGHGKLRQPVVRRLRPDLSPADLRGGDPE